MMHYLRPVQPGSMTALLSIPLFSSRPRSLAIRMEVEPSPKVERQKAFPEQLSKMARRMELQEQEQVANKMAKWMD